MEKEEVNYFSEGDQLGATLFLPDDGDPKAGIVSNPGFLGIKDRDRTEKYSKVITDAGYAMLCFDYRGLGTSEGEALLYPERQVEDFRNSITYLQTRDEIDENRIGIYASGGVGGGHGPYIAGIDERVKCTVATTCIGDGRKWLRGMRREYEWLELLDQIEQNKQRRVLEGEPKLVDARGEDGLHIPTPEREKNQRKKIKNVDPKVPDKFPLQCAERVMDYRPIDVVDNISPRAIMFVAVEGDDTTPEEHAIEMYNKANEPKKLVMQKNTTHYKSYDKYFDKVTQEMINWYDEHLLKPQPNVEVHSKT